MEFVNKVFVVTGGGNGIGREVVLQLLSKGARVCALDISEKGLQETQSLAGELASRLTIHILDVTNQTAVESMPQIVLTEHGRVDAVINVAGIIQPFVRVNELTYDQINRVMNINFYGPLYMIKSFLPHLLANKTQSYICNVSSMGGFLPVPGQSIYGASKAGLKLLTEGLYAELKHTNVGVSVVFPGGVATNITKNSNVEVKVTEGAKSYTMTTAPKAAEIILNGIAKNKLKIIVGKDAAFMDFIYRLAPTKAVNFITKQMKSLLK